MMTSSPNIAQPSSSRAAATVHRPSGPTLQWYADPYEYPSTTSCIKISLNPKASFRFLCLRFSVQVRGSFDDWQRDTPLLVKNEQEGRFKAEILVDLERLPEAYQEETYSSAGGDGEAVAAKSDADGELPPGAKLRHKLIYKFVLDGHQWVTEAGQSLERLQHRPSPPLTSRMTHPHTVLHSPATVPSFVRVQVSTPARHELWRSESRLYGAGCSPDDGALDFGATTARDDDVGVVN
ncbi:hypothetical protein KI688_006704 [Linnemannia hyalina]|uniref:AMP-activated protein kinase glycogen-binding domain-containing protein n=1 Tax=Linnemannia hyalina TaxID=64524 RepID=A0A9P7XJ09_9FUNG|nr:hypothetical protein KI688_006704 [Linnemannia hyalina]